MRAVRLLGPGRVLVDDVADPTIVADGDAIVAVEATGICGTDLHPYRGEIDGFRYGTVMGHEFAGTVVETGPAVSTLAAGDRVTVSDIVACGRCWHCRRGLHYHCDHVSLFGLGDVVGPYVAGGQAELVRVPFADVVAAPLPPDVTAIQAVFLGDVAVTAFAAARDAGVEPGDTVAVVGCGPVGRLAAACAEIMGAADVICVDPDQARAAGPAGSVLRGVTPAAAAAVVAGATDGRGAARVIEAVGSDDALLAAIDLAAPGATVCAVGAHHSTAMPFPTLTAFARELTIRFTVGDPIRDRDRVLGLIRSGRLDPATLVSHQLDLADAALGYELFASRRASKVVLTPGTTAA